MKSILGFIPVSLFMAVLAVAAAWAEDDPTLSPLAQKTQTLVDSAYTYVLEHSDDMSAVQEALEQDPRFHDHENGLYIFIHCYDLEKKEAICCGQGIRPELVGRNMWSLRTPNGRLLFYEIALIIERDGAGWIEYDWLNPYNNIIQTKRSYIRGIRFKDGRKRWIGSGFWKK